MGVGAPTPEPYKWRLAAVRESPRTWLPDWTPVALPPDFCSHPCPAAPTPSWPYLLVDDPKNVMGGGRAAEPHPGGRSWDTGPSATAAKGLVDAAQGWGSMQSGSRRALLPGLQTYGPSEGVFLFHGDALCGLGNTGAAGGLRGCSPGWTGWVPLGEERQAGPGGTLP